MKFWGIEVKAGEPFEFEPFPGQLVHISQAALGVPTAKDVKGGRSIPLHLKIDDKDCIIGSLIPEERTQVTFDDLVFGKKFVVSHDWKNGSIYFAGHLADEPVPDKEFFIDDYSSEDYSVDNSSEDEFEKGNKKGQNAAPSKAPAGKNAAGNKSKHSPKSGGRGGAGHSGKKGKRGNK